MKKVKIIITVVLLLAATITTLATLALLKNKQAPQMSNQANPDSYIVNVSYKKMDQNGKLNSITRSRYAQHYTKQDSAKFISPDITIIQSNQQQPWHITAQYGTSKNGAETIELFDDVLLQQSSGPRNSELTVTTSAATIFLREKRVETKQQITIKKPGILVTALGATANMNSKKIILLNKVVQTKTDGFSNDQSPAHLTANKAIYDRQNHLSTYLGNVHYKQNTTTLNCQKLLVYDNQSNNKIYKIIAFGRQASYSTLPKGKQERLYATANKISYYPQQNLAKLLGKAEVKQGANLFAGEEIKYDTKQQTVAANSVKNNRIRIIIQP